MPHLPRRLLLAALAFSWVAVAASTASAAERAPWSDGAFAAALGLATQAGTAAQATMVMAAFAPGAALPLLALGTVTRSALPRLRRHLAKAGGWGRPALGGVLALVGGAMLSGLDRRVEAVLTAALPDGWVELINRF